MNLEQRRIGVRKKTTVEKFVTLVNATEHADDLIDTLIGNWG